MSKYKEIETNRNMSFEEETKKPVIVEVELDDIIQAPLEQESISAPIDQPRNEDKEKRRQSRAKDRIKQLLAERDEALAIADRERQEKIEWQKKASTGNKSNKEAHKTTLEAQVKSIQKQMVEAIKAGNAEESVELTDQLATARMELAGVSAELQNTPVETKEDSQPIRQPVQNQVPERAQDWIADHPEFKVDELFRGTALYYNNQLLNEGMDPNQDDFYEELDARLSKRFPELFGVVDKKQVELSEIDDSSSAVEQDVKKTTAKVRTTEQTVSGSSRSAPAKSIQPRKPQTVELSQSDLVQAERWGLTAKQMARRILHTEKTKRSDGYSPILMGKDE